MRPLILSLVLSSCLAGNVFACGLKIDAQFLEGAPRDRFEIVNASSKKWKITGATVDLSPSKGKLIFDTKDGGTGVEVFQPFRTEAGSAKLRQPIEPNDGSKMLALDFESFEQGQSYTFSIDVDDTLTKSELGQIRVSGGEISGTVIDFKLVGPDGAISNASMVFKENAKANLLGKACS